MSRYWALALRYGSFLSVGGVVQRVRIAGVRVVEFGTSNICRSRRETLLLSAMLPKQWQRWQLDRRPESIIMLAWLLWSIDKIKDFAPVFGTVSLTSSRLYLSGNIRSVLLHTRSKHCKEMFILNSDDEFNYCNVAFPDVLVMLQLAKTFLNKKTPLSQGQRAMPQ